MTIRNMASQLKAWRDRPETDSTEAPDKTNWSVVPANDNNPEDIEDMRLERRLEIVPSIKSIREAIDSGIVERNSAGRIVAIGHLRFSDGTQTERAYCYGPEGKLIQFDARMPIGAMLGTKEKADALSGTGVSHAHVAASNAFAAVVFDVDMPRYVSGKRERRKGKSYSHEESRRMLADAYANTPVLPAVTVCPPALASGTRRAADAFVGLQKGKKGESGSIAWEDIASSKIHREIWDETLATLNAETKRTLDAAAKAKTLADIKPGGHRTAASRRGKRLLVAANDNLMAAIKKAAS